MRSPTLVLSSLVLLASSALPQDGGAPPQAATRTSRALPGKLPGSERWLVTFKTRSFDLEGYRQAILAQRPAAEVAQLVADLEQKARADQFAFVNFVEQLGGRVTDQWWLINACAVEVLPARLAQLRAHANVLYLHADEISEPVSIIKTATNSQNHNADGVHALNLKGSGVGIAIMDTGQDSNMGASGRPHATYYVNGDINNNTGGGLNGSRLLANILVGTVGPDDPHDHGTGVSGIACGEKWNTDASSDRGHAPLASIVGYGISENTGGGSSFTTIATAWQKIATDRATYKLVSANNSYTGTPDPLNPSQQALDAAAYNADVMVCVAAANSGASTTGSQACVNGLAVGAVENDNRRVASFSSRGPLSGDTQRFYPDLCANGVNTVMPKRDTEAGGVNYVASGTSMASPQVCGAAALYRSVKPAANALETKAALLATTEDVSQKNLTPPYNSRNAYGLGYLRDDTLVQVALGNGFVQNSTLTTTTTSRQFQMNVTPGKTYSVAIAWPRTIMTQTTWSNLDLDVKQGANSLGSSTTPRNLYEKVVFTVASGTTVDFLVTGTSLETGAATIPFALVALEVPPQYIQGSMTSYGSGCAGTGSSGNVSTIAPASYATAFGGLGHQMPLGYSPHRYQQIFAESQVSSAFVASSLAFRHASATAPDGLAYNVDLEISLGRSNMTPATLTNTFANNFAGAPTRVFNRKTINYPVLTAANASVSNFAVKIPLDTAFPWAPQAGTTLLFESSVTRTSHAVVNYLMDAFTNTSAPPATRLISFQPTGATGSLAVGSGVVIGIIQSGGAVPSLASTSVPAIGQTYNLDLQGAKGTTQALLLLGTSSTTWGSFSLPLSLAFLGAPTCSLQTSIEASLGMATTAGGTATFAIPVPLDKSLIQANLYHQVSVLDAGANALGLAFSNGMRARLGGQP